MKVIVEYNDTTSFTAKEIKQNLQFLLGDNAEVTFHPTSNEPKAHIYYGLEAIINEIQIAEYFDSEKLTYEIRMEVMKEEILKIVSDTVDDIILRNEEKISCP